MCLYSGHLSSTENICIARCQCIIYMGVGMHRGQNIYSEVIT